MVTGFYHKVGPVRCRRLQVLPVLHGGATKSRKKKSQESSSVRVSEHTTFFLILTSEGRGDHIARGGVLMCSAHTTLLLCT